MDNNTFERPGGTWYDAQQQAEGRTTRWWLWSGIGGTTAVALAFLAGFLGGHQPVSGLQQTSSRLEHQLNSVHQQEQALLLHRHCTTDDTQIHYVQQLLQAGQPDAAAAFVEVALRKADPPACPQTRIELGALAYTARLNALFSRVEVSPLDHGPVLAWLSAERQADAVGVPTEQRLSPLSVVAQAYNAHLWELARAAFLTAWHQGLVGPGDVGEVERYYAILRNYGRVLAQETTGENYQRGLVLLRTADAVSQAYQLGRGEAATDLQSLVAGRHAPWPALDNSDSVLRAASSKR